MKSSSTFAFAAGRVQELDRHRRRTEIIQYCAPSPETNSFANNRRSASDRAQIVEDEFAADPIAHRAPRAAA